MRPGGVRSETVERLRRDTAPMLDAMTHRAGDARLLVANETFALGHLPFRTAKDEVDRCLPLQVDDLTLALDGRIDNRSELWRLIDQPPPLATMSDAALLLELFRARGEECFDLILGPFVVVVADSKRQIVWMARDGLGGRSISYFLNPDWLIAASEAQAVAAHHAVGASIDERRLARFFAVDENAGETSFFRGVEALGAGEVLVVTPDRVSRRSFGALRPPEEIDLALSEHEWCERFRDLLDASVACRTQAPETTGPPGVLLSGGLDSAPIATSLSASERFSERAIPTYSWVFERHEASDERRYLNDLEGSGRFRPKHILCDDTGLDLGSDGWPIHPATPEQNPYRLFHQRAYEAAERDGVQVLLSGMCGDQLYSGTEHWLADLAGSGRWRSLGAELIRLMSERRLVSRTTVRGLIPARRFERLRGNRSPAWLTPEAASWLDGERSELDRASTSSRVQKVPDWVQRPRQYRLLTAAMNGHGLAIERYYARRHGVELRYPLRDRRLIELLLAAPTSLLFSGGMTRPIVRRALADRLPASIRRRRDKASFEPVLREDLFDGPVAKIRPWLLSNRSTWSQFVRPEWLQPATLDRDCSPLRLLVAWHCVGFTSWLNRVRYS